MLARVAEAVKAPSQTFQAVQSEAQFFASLSTAVSTGKAPERLLTGFKILYTNYRGTQAHRLAELARQEPANSSRTSSAADAVLGSDVPGATEQEVAEVMAAIADRVMTDIQQPYTFPSLHTRILQPYDYYKFGQAGAAAAAMLTSPTHLLKLGLAAAQRYVRWLINFKKSVLGNLAIFSQIQEQLDAGQNVVLLANHQTEADPGKHSAGSLRTRLATALPLAAAWCQACSLQVKGERAAANGLECRLSLSACMPWHQAQVSQLQRRSLVACRCCRQPRPAPHRICRFGARRAAYCARAQAQRLQGCGRCCWRARTHAWQQMSSMSRGTAWWQTRCANPSAWGATCSACTRASTWTTTPPRRRPSSAPTARRSPRWLRPSARHASCLWIRSQG